VVTTEVASRVDAAWAVLHTVPDPEVPAVSVCDLGIVREVIEHDDGLEVVLTPTYSGCPATEAIEHDGRDKLKAYGIAPPAHLTPEQASTTAMPIKLFGRMAGERIACPRCASERTERLSAFGSTACKALYRCMACREPFEHFKPI
jgi:ring-1,2-phenylacetyl-CoA epoxidase subunit PaaD